MGLARVLFEGFWLGIGTRRFFHGIDDFCYRSWSRYHDESYNRGGLHAWEARVIEQYFQGRESVLLAAAGGGREALALTKMGFQVRGFECHEGLRNVANGLLAQASPDNSILACKRDHCPDLDETFDGLIIGWGAYMLIQESHRRVAFLRRMRARTVPGAPLLLSFYYRDGDTRQLLWTARLANFLRMICFRSKVEIGDRLAPNFVHYFSRNEIERELALADFQLVSFNTLEYGHAVAAARKAP